jgi:hypothetical protein
MRRLARIWTAIRIAFGLALIVVWAAWALSRDPQAFD